jgi:hypothetical protein
MPAIKTETFGGMVPIIDARLLQPNNAVYAENSWLLNGRLAPITAIVPIHTLVNPDAQYAYRIPEVSSSVKNIADSLWLEFVNPNTVVVKSPVTGQEDPRYYWTDGQNPPGYTTRSRIIAGDPPLLLGIPSPIVPPTVTVTGGTGPIETRTYAYSWVSAYAEEGQPSLPSDPTSGNVTGTWHVAMTAPTVDDMTNRDLTRTRIYRTVTSTQGVASFYFVAEIPIAQLTYDDTIPDGTVALNNPMTSADYEMPLEDLEGMVPMPNGFLIGWVRNEVWFCEPYLPHAWPTKYMIGVEANVVGVGVWGQSAVILCEGQSYTVTGITPDSMVLAKIPPLEPCGSKGSIINTPEGVVYASQNGLIQVTPYGGHNVTFNLIDKAQFPKMLRIDNLHAAWLVNGWFGLGGVSDEVWQADFVQQTPLAFQQKDYTGAYLGVWINYKDPRVGVVWFPSPTPIFNVMQDDWTGEVLIIRDGQVQHIDFSKDFPRTKYRWRSKEFQMPFRQNWGAARIFSYAPPGPPPEGPTYFRFICDGVVKYENQIVKDGQVFRMPSGFKPDVVQFEIEGYLEILNVQAGQSPRDLRQV